MENEIRLYVFLSQGGTTEEKLVLAATDYFSRSGIPAPPPEAFSVARRDRGKPYFPHLPRLDCSVSHSGDVFVCAIAPCSVGVDLQLHRRGRGEAEEAERRERIARRYFSPREQEYIKEEKEAGFYLLWTARESLVKRIGCGIDSHFPEYCVLPPRESPITTGAQGERRWQAQDSFFYSQSREGYTLTLCSTEKIAVSFLFASEKGFLPK